MSQEKKLEMAIKQSEQRFAGDSQISSFEQSIQEFNKMVDSGVAKPRGYNILSIESSYLVYSQGHFE